MLFSVLDDFMQNKGYVNITAGISNPLAIALPPAGCENAPMVAAHYVSHLIDYQSYIVCKGVATLTLIVRFIFSRYKNVLTPPEGQTNKIVSVLSKTCFK